MKLNRLSTTDRTLTREAAERARATANVPIRRVEALEGTESDRQRSLQQEIDEIQAKAVGPFEGEEQVLQSARDVAGKLARLGQDAATLVRAEKRPQCYAIDDKA